MKIKVNVIATDEHGKKIWVDRDQLLLEAAFQILRDFVEKENVRRIDWNHDATHRAAWKEISSLYRWWTKERLRRKNPIDAKGVKCPPLETEPVPGSASVRLVPYDKKKYRPWTLACKKSWDLEVKWEQEDQRNFHRLVEIRRFLWT